MEIYKDVDGDSGISAYEIGEDRVSIRLISGAIYVYTFASAGREHIENMKKLAKGGDGLNSYIKRNKVPYVAKL
ncbi:hypothetical protein LG201_13010 [Methylobacillus gramineus]|uniref:hypothetical protein n=1 Tax=Methylobacillus gramineus TaxID=755169 RepID=UPI001D000566|nr:hypothetical protein [Methylobacillus gramineus]MCB5186127.1 hypothetical protein [Methylobacillus gramineus]